MCRYKICLSICLIFLSLIIINPSHSQNLTGQWEGSINAYNQDTKQYTPIQVTLKILHNDDKIMGSMKEYLDYPYTFYVSEIAGIQSANYITIRTTKILQKKQTSFYNHNLIQINLTYNNQTLSGKLVSFNKKNTNSNNANSYTIELKKIDDKIYPIDDLYQYPTHSFNKQKINTETEVEEMLQKIDNMFNNIQHIRLTPPPVKYIDKKKTNNNIPTPSLTSSVATPKNNTIVQYKSHDNITTDTTIKPIQKNIKKEPITPTNKTLALEPKIKKNQIHNTPEKPLPTYSSTTNTIDNKTEKVYVNITPEITSIPNYNKKNNVSPTQNTYDNVDTFVVNYDRQRLKKQLLTDKNTLAAFKYLLTKKDTNYFPLHFINPVIAIKITPNYPQAFHQDSIAFLVDLFPVCINYSLAKNDFIKFIKLTKGKHQLILINTNQTQSWQTYSYNLEITEFATQQQSNTPNPSVITINAQHNENSRIVIPIVIADKDE